MTRKDHSFQFEAVAIARAALEEALYHEERAKYWQSEMDTAYTRVEATIGAKIQQQTVTGGWRADVVVDYGDPSAYRRLNEATTKLHTHLEAAARFRTDGRLYTTQGDRKYDLSTEDVHYFRLGGGPRDD